MTWEQIQTYVIGLAVSAIVGFVGFVGRYFGVKLSVEQKRMAQWAVEQGVAYAALRLKNATGEQKKDAAIKVAKELEPRAMRSLDDAQKSMLIESTYARLKPSLPTPSEAASYDIPVDVVGFEAAPTPLPRPKVKLP